MSNEKYDHTIKRFKHSPIFIEIEPVGDLQGTCGFCVEEYDWQVYFDIDYLPEVIDEMHMQLFSVNGLEHGNPRWEASGSCRTLSQAKEKANRAALKLHNKFIKELVKQTNQAVKRLEREHKKKLTAVQKYVARYVKE